LGVNKVSRLKWFCTRPLEPGPVSLESIMPRKRPKGRPGRKSGLTVDVALRVGAAIARNPGRIMRVSRDTDIPKTTLYRWIEWGEKGDKRFASLAAMARPEQKPEPSLAELLEKLVRKGTLTSSEAGLNVG
jgi:hypothetical protein